MDAAGGRFRTVELTRARHTTPLPTANTVPVTPRGRAFFTTPTHWPGGQWTRTSAAFWFVETLTHGGYRHHRRDFFFLPTHTVVVPFVDLHYTTRLPGCTGAVPPHTTYFTHAAHPPIPRYRMDMPTPERFPTTTWFLTDAVLR